MRWNQISWYDMAQFLERDFRTRVKHLTLECPSPQCAQQKHPSIWSKLLTAWLKIDLSKRSYWFRSTLSLCGKGLRICRHADGFCMFRKWYLTFDDEVKFIHEVMRNVRLRSILPYLNDKFTLSIVRIDHQQKFIAVFSNYIKTYYCVKVSSEPARVAVESVHTSGVSQYASSKTIQNMYFMIANF